MDSSDDLKLSIPKPCHENWSEMTPNEKGAFCKLCAKSVIDFTQKSVQEIKDFLLEKKNEKVCGRVNSDQLDIQPKLVGLQIPLSGIPRRMSLSNLFAIAAFISFGTTLFSCNTEDGHKVGDIVAVADTGKGKETPSKVMGQATVLEIDTPAVKQVPETKGEMKMEDKKSVCKPLIMGDVDVSQEIEKIITR